MQTTTKTKEASGMQRRIFFGAIILALLVHGILLVSFEYAPAKKIYSNTRTAGVSFLNLASQSPSQRRELLNWLDYHEPSLISAPNVKYGYNQLNPYVHFRSACPDKVHQAVLPVIPEKKPKEFSSLKIHNQAANALPQNFIFKRPRQVTVALPKPVLPKITYPLIKNGSAVVKLSFSPYLIKDSRKLEAKSMRIDYNLEQDRMLPRVVIVNSSGSYDFDMLVLRELSLHIDDIAQGGKDFTITIQWRGEEK